MGKSIKKRLSHKPDQYTSFGPFEMAQFGNTVVMRNNMSEEDHERIMAKLAGDYPDTYTKIDELVNSIRSLVVRCDPLQLLVQGYYGMLFSMLNKSSEFQFDFDDTVAVRMIDYVQSIIVSTPPLENREESQDLVISELSNKVSELYSNLHHFHMTHSAYLKENDPEYDPEYDMLYVQAQELRTTVRGDRYAVHEIEHLRDLLTPHNEIFIELFNIGIEDFLDGIRKLQFSLMQGINQLMTDMEELRERTLEAVEKKLATEHLFSDPRDAMNEVVNEKGLGELKESVTNRLFGYDLFDVRKITGLPDSLLRELAWKPGEDKDFFATGEYAGWPLRKLPIEVRPFISIDKNYYCFDLYSLFDNLYRVIQRLIIRLKPEYKQEWNTKQKEVSEELPFRLFCNLLSGAEVFQSIYYPSSTGKSGKKEWCENDGIIIFDDHLIVIEVKAGSFTYTPPSTDFPAYIQSIKTLIKSPRDQAKRFIDYLFSAETVTVYDEQHNPIRNLRSSDFRQVTICGITIDNFNSFAARASKLTPLGVELNLTPVWSISVDDLRVCLDYFDSPSKFTHFMEQRYKAAQSEEIELFDELDHLGMYIKHNHYVTRAIESGGRRVLWQGYREELDNYFVKLIFDEEALDKPKQNIPAMIEDIIKMLDHQAKKGRCKVVSSLLDMDGDTREQIEAQLITVLRRQSETGRLMPLSLFGEVKITIACNQEGITSFSNEYVNDYILATLLRTNDSERLGLYLTYSRDGVLIDVDFSYLTKDNIPDARKEEIEKKSVEYAESRIASFKKQTGAKKIGRNNICPCGSGKKYKKCCDN
ncbi:SEC-C metal-binding domain-containing protein [Paenibacillus radicis (ex Xue et al. 2023)]|uniref:SEC-C metal-binding domain-containing protein n=1 Tax=Paenibacillus radicis (ex Xue et al. 2023) TaxID=2972489 RepID=A0ABT1YJ41_9BACL|nr:SEC-C metal-binding domain-containing protein [Paenibacillus radicis (ex Xue et al. 2023)]MCR8633213.1 SEC-C metal-binding domain-containing protein [Paenibacillus radicis (ex Xue et al. 2023)]